MCGISAIISKNHENIMPLLFESIKQLQNRGYDSIGFSYRDVIGDVFIHKKAMTENENCNDFLISHNNKISSMAMAHTRWATHGSVTDSNSHPHISFDNRVSIVHNGIIENYKDLKKMLVSNLSIKFNTETDSEIIANVIAYRLSIDNDETKAIENAIELLQGTYGLCIMFNGTDNIYAVKNGSPLLIGETDNKIIISSETSGFCKEVNNYISLEPKNVICVSYSGINNLNNNKVRTIENLDYDLTPAPYPHWTLKEINEQEDSIKRAYSYGGRIRDNKVCLGGLQIIKNAPKKLILLGCGTSLHACQIAVYYFKKYKYFDSINCYDGAEFTSDDFIENSIIIFVSQSGETKDLYNCLKEIKNKDCISIGIINCVDSYIAREVDCGVYLNAMREVGVASTKSFTSSLVVLSLISIWFQQENLCSKTYHTSCINDLNKLSTQISNTFKSINVIEGISDILIKCQSMFILGKGKMQYIAKEAALKLKEITYIHAEGYSGSSLKHGPFALLTTDTPVIFLIDDDNYDKMMNSYEEVKSRNSPCIIISNIKNNNNIPNYIHVETNKNYQEIIYIVVLQLLSYCTSIRKGINPDKPRNLAKVVTVD